MHHKPIINDETKILAMKIHGLIETLGDYLRPSPPSSPSVTVLCRSWISETSIRCELWLHSCGNIHLRFSGTHSVNDWLVDGYRPIVQAHSETNSPSDIRRCSHSYQGMWRVKNPVQYFRLPWTHLWKIGNTQDETDGVQDVGLSRAVETRDSIKLGVEARNNSARRVWFEPFDGDILHVHVGNLTWKQVQ